MLSAFTAFPIVKLKPRDKSKIESILAYGDRLMVGLNTGTLRIYRLNESPDEKQYAQDSSEKNSISATPKPIDLLKEVEKFSTKPIEQLAIIKESNILISLSNSCIFIHDLHSFTLQQQLTKTKGASTFAITSNIVKDVATGIPEIISRLAVSVKRKLLIWSWHESEMESDVSEIIMTEAIRTLQWISATNVLCGLSSGYVIVDMKSKSVQNLNGPGTMGSASNISAGRLASVGTASMGYMGLGGYISKPLITKLAGEEILLVKDVNSAFISSEGHTLSKKQISWQQAPEAIGYSYPYILALQPPSQSKLEIRNPETLSLLQSISLPNARLLHIPPPTVSLAHAGKGFHVASERCIWRMESIDYNSQVDELVHNGEYDEAISVLNMLEDALLHNKRKRLREIKIQKAQKLFDKKKYQDAINIFMAQDVQAPPERVIKLFPRIIAGDLTTFDQNITDSIIEGNFQNGSETRHPTTTTGDSESALNNALDIPKPPSAGKTLISQLNVQSDTSSINSEKQINSRDEKNIVTNSGEGIELAMSEKDLEIAVLALIGFLVEARNRMKAFLDVETGKMKANKHIDQIGLLQDTFESFLTAPRAITDSDREEKLRETAKLIDTTLFRSYVLARPRLAGNLFRIPNFCDPDVVQEQLLRSGQYHDLVDFFYGKKLHRSALELLKRFGSSDADEGVPEKLRGPKLTVSYLQKLPADLFELILEFADWPLRTNPSLGMEIFLADTKNAETLPRNKVVLFLKRIDEKLSVRYLEHLVNELGDLSPEFHNKLITAYFSQLKCKTKEKQDSDYRKELMRKLIEFMKTSSQYSLGKAYDLVPKDDHSFYEAQAVILSNMGQYKKALEIYVFKIKDYERSEEYCNEIFRSSLDKGSSLTIGSYDSKSAPIDENSENTPLTIHQTLLSLYLTPPSPYEPNLCSALQLLANHGPRLPASKTLSLIPDSLPVSSLETYFRTRICDVNSKLKAHRVTAGLHKSEVVRAQANLMLGSSKVIEGNKRYSALRSLRIGGKNRRVIISDDRVCRGCFKRLGNSVVAVTPDDTVVHYGCLGKVGDIHENQNNTSAML